MACKTIATVETMNFRIICFIKILQPTLGWQNLDRTIAYSRFHRIKGGGRVVKFDHLKLYLCKASELREINPSDSIPNVF